MPRSSVGAGIFFGDLLLLVHFVGLTFRLFRSAGVEFTYPIPVSLLGMLGSLTFEFFSIVEVGAFDLATGRFDS